MLGAQIILAAALLTSKWKINLVNHEPNEQEVTVEVGSRPPVHFTVGGGQSIPARIEGRDGDQFRVYLEDGRSNPKLGTGTLDMWHRNNTGTVVVWAPKYAPERQDAVWELVTMAAEGGFEGKQNDGTLTARSPSMSKFHFSTSTSKKLPPLRSSRARLLLIRVGWSVSTRISYLEN